MRAVVAAAAVGLALLAAPLPLDPPAHRLAAIFAGTAVMWVTEALPLGASSLLAMALCAAAGVADPKEVFKTFGDPVMPLMLGSFMLANALSACGLDRRIAGAAARAPGVDGRAWRLFAALGVVTALISCWITNTATTAMMIPIALGVVGRLNGPEALRKRYAACLLLLTAYASTAGGLGTPVGTGTNFIGLAQLRAEGIQISFLSWMGFGLPMAAAQVAALLLIFRLHTGPTAGRLTVTPDDRDGHGRALTVPQRWTAFAFVLAAGMWVAPSVLGLALGKDHPGAAFAAAHLPESAVPFLALGLLVVARHRGRPVLPWPAAMAVDWDALLLFAGGVSLGNLSFTTGLAGVIGRGLVSATGATGLWELAAVFAVIALVVSELSSNVATASMLVPVAIASAKAAGVSPVAPALAATIAASLGCMLPVSTPPNALVWGTGRVPFRTMLKLGLAFDVLGFAIVWGGLRLLLPLLGLA